MNRLHLHGIWPILILAGCTSAPVHYYTLVAPETSHVVASSEPTRFDFTLLPIGIPAQVDQPQLAVREGRQRIRLLNGQRWVAPLADEIHSALATDLAYAMRARPVGDLSGANRRRVHIKVDLRRFDSVPGRYILIDALWRIQIPKDRHALVCTTRVREKVSHGFSALVAGHQRALAALASRIAVVAPKLLAGQIPVCPGR